MLFIEDLIGVLPLDIVGMPEYEKLSEPERSLCTELRLIMLTCSNEQGEF